MLSTLSAQASPRSVSAGCGRTCGSTTILESLKQTASVTRTKSILIPVRVSTPKSAGQISNWPVLAATINWSEPVPKSGTS